MKRAKKTEFHITDDAVDAFQRMVRHQLELWDASTELEHLLKCEVDSGGVGYLAACFGEPHTADQLTADDLRHWLQCNAGEPTEEDE